jgi:hypothetical protein
MSDSETLAKLEKRVEELETRVEHLQAGYAEGWHRRVMPNDKALRGLLEKLITAHPDLKADWEAILGIMKPV